MVMAEIWTMGELLAEIMRPERGVPLGTTGAFVGPFPSGAPGIFIDTVARLGRSAAIVAGVGDDDLGRAIVARLRRDGVRTELIEVVPGRSTGVAFVAYAEDGSRTYVFHWDGTPAVMAGLPDPAVVVDPRFFHVMGCSLMANDAFRDRLIGATELFAAKGALITFDPNVRAELLGDRTIEEIAQPILRRCAYLFPGEAELLMLGGGTSLDAAAEALLGRYPLVAIVLKRGRLGCSVYGGSGRIDVPAFEIEEVDPTGAGDCFDAGFLCGLLEGHDLAEAARLGAAAGALNASAFGPMEGDISRTSVAALLGHG